MTPLLGRRQSKCKIRDTHHIICHLYGSIKHLVNGSTYRSKVIEGRDVRFTGYGGERAKCLHYGGVCRIELMSIYTGLLCTFSYLKQSQANCYLQFRNKQVALKLYGKDEYKGCLFSTFPNLQTSERITNIPCLLK